MTDSRWRLPLASLALLLGGCSQAFYQLGEPLPPAYEQEAGGQPLAAVLAELGPPQRISATPAGFVMGWEHWRIAEAAVGLSLGFLGADALTVDWGDARVAGDFLLVSFDHAHRVARADRVRWNSDVGGGAAVQPLVGVAPIVSVEDLLRPLPQHGWGASNLLPMPAAQNLPNRPDQGATGIEQRGTPAGAGQRSLELD
ncbi:MAG TPA: hypothetical protein VJ947_00890 [Pseudohaliea sp.]|nr:hypothetical protein [Pseudohaliea sp.]